MTEAVDGGAPPFDSETPAGANSAEKKITGTTEDKG